jgi:hypothetical protein
MTADTCPIWGTPAKFVPTNRDGHSIDSPRAGGQYFISRTAAVTLRNCDDVLRARLTTWLIEQRQHGVDWPEVTTHTVENAQRRRPLTVRERADGLLRLLASEQGHIGDRITIEITNAAAVLYGSGHNELGGRLLAHCESIAPSEGEYLLEQLGRQGLVDLSAQNDDSCDCIITVDGYTHLSDLERHTVNSTQGFVAMWFDDSMAPAAVGIEAAILDAGYKPLRIDGKEHNNKIDDDNIAEIRRTRFLVADFTQGESGARGGVY